MSRVVRSIPLNVIEDLGRALEIGSVNWPPSVTELRRLGLGESAGDVASEMGHLAAQASPAAAVRWALQLVFHEREEARRAADRVELVWTGPEVPGSLSRDTGVVVRELFASAERSVLVSTYAIHQGRQVFEVLATRMRERPGLRVRLFVHVGRGHQDTRTVPEILKAFENSFRSEWPGDSWPDVYYDPRSLALHASERTSLHAKCIVIDDRRSLVTSANFTEAAQERNMEAGVLVDDAGFAVSLSGQFDCLVRDKTLHRLKL